VQILKNLRSFKIKLQTVAKQNEQENCVKCVFQNRFVGGWVGFGGFWVGGWMGFGGFWVGGWMGVSSISKHIK